MDFDRVGARVNQDWDHSSMSHPSKRKGSSYERELVNQAKELGLEAERAYASNGKALGCTEGVDLKVEGIRIQAKRRKKLAEYLQIPDGADAVVFREDHGQSLTLIRYEYFLELLEVNRANSLRQEGAV
jgi:Holliday junction resolvase